MTTLIIFYIVNILCLKDLSARIIDHSAKKCYETVMYIFCIIIMFIQFSILTLMSMQMDETTLFYKMLLLILCIDIIWVIIMWALKTIRIGIEKPFEFILVPRGWALINLLGAILVIYANSNLPYSQSAGNILGPIFIIIFLSDMHLDYFRIFR